MNSSGCRRLLQLVLEKVGSGGYLPVHCKGVSSAAAIVLAPFETNVSFVVKPILPVLQAVPEGQNCPRPEGLPRRSAGVFAPATAGTSQTRPKARRSSVLQAQR